MDKRFWAVIGVIIVIFLGVFYINGKKSSAPSNKAALTNHVEGNKSSGVTLVEYGDFQCPVCASYFSTIKQVTDKYKDKVQFQFRNFPLTNLHPNAFAAARAAEAAGKQNKYWEMHDLLYEENVKYITAQDQKQTYNTWVNASDPSNDFNNYAKQLGLNLTQFQQDFKSQSVNDAIKADEADANQRGFTGTPTFLVNGDKYDNNQFTDPSTGLPSVEKFSQVLDSAIAAQQNKK